MNAPSLRRQTGCEITEKIIGVMTSRLSDDDDSARQMGSLDAGELLDLRDRVRYLIDMENSTHRLPGKPGASQDDPARPVAVHFGNDLAQRLTVEDELARSPGGRGCQVGRFDRAEPIG